MNIKHFHFIDDLKNQIVTLNFILFPKFHFISSFLYDTTSKIYRKYRQRIDSLRKGMVLESGARQREAEEKAIDEIAGTSESLADKGKTVCVFYSILYPACSK